MTHYVFSTMTDSVEYVEWIRGGADLPKKGRSVLIKGGANVAGKHLVTPRGVVTAVSDEQLELLEKDPTFNVHRNAGFITIDKKKVSIDKMVANMQKKDEAAPLTPEDYKQTAKGMPSRRGLVPGVI